MHIDLRALVLFVHILLAIAWLGGILFVGWGVYPAVKKLSYQAQRDFLYVMMKHSHILLTLAGASVIITGILLGTYLGPLKTVAMLTSTSYGQLFSLAFLLALTGLLWGAFVSYRVTMNMIKNDQLWRTAINGMNAPLKEKMRRVTFISAFEVICLFIVVWIMVLL